MNRQLFEYHPTIGYRFIPGLKTREPHEGGGFLLRTNQAGYRCRHEFVARKAPGRFRILLFGDSYTAGMGVCDSARYGDLLEDLVPGVEVFNFGLPGSGTDQQYLIFREDAAGLEHDLIVIAVMVENIRRVASRYRPYLTLEGEELTLAKPYYSLEPDGSLELHHVPVPKKALPPDSEEQEFVDRFGKLAGIRHAVNRLGPASRSGCSAGPVTSPCPPTTGPTIPTGAC